ncbi:MAG: hypothetical protein AAFQ82_15740 [Myxococcota bacterium]
MRFKLQILSGWALMTALGIPARAAQPKIQSCAEYRVTKRSFLVTEQTVTGRTCEVLVSVSQVERDRYTLRGSFDWNTVDSGSSLRDSHVAEHFAHDGQSRVVFESDPISKDALGQLALGRAKPRVNGHLTVGKQRASVVFELERVSVGRMRARAETGFEALGLEPPSAGAGVVAKVRDPLVLVLELDLVTVDMSTAPRLRALYDQPELAEAMQ